jgi:hypothetical protein
VSDARQLSKDAPRTTLLRVAPETAERIVEQIDGAEALVDPQQSPQFLVRRNLRGQLSRGAISPIDGI